MNPRHEHFRQIPQAQLVALAQEHYDGNDVIGYFALFGTLALRSLNCLPHRQRNRR
jgi:hypothetical protein